MFDNYFGENFVHPFGNPINPRKNITGGSLIMVVAAFEFGAFFQRALRSGAVRVDYFLLLLIAGLFFLGIKTFRHGLAVVPLDPAKQRTNQPRERTTPEWIALVLFWILLIVAPVAIIKFVVR